MMLQLPKHKFEMNSAAGSEPEDGPTPPRYPRVSKSGHRCFHLHPDSEPHKRNAQWFVWMRANDPSAGSPTETLLRLLLPLSDKVHETFRCNVQELNTAAVRIIHRITQSVGATGGVYKGQGRNQHELMTRAY